MTDKPDKLCFFDLDPGGVAAALGEMGWPAFRARQILDWVYRKMETDVRAMTNLNQRDRAALEKRFSFATARIAQEQCSTDETLKLLLVWPDGRSAETVMIPDGQRRTACISSQTGCPVGCKFCASGMNGLQGNLSPGQIVEQVFALNRAITKHHSYISNIVLMGMGEPLANYSNVMAAMRILHAPEGFGLGARRITLSTVGIPARIRNLADEGLPINLALSLHAPNEHLRRQLIPWAEHFPLGDVLDAVRYYFQRTGREVTFEYILLSGVNDRPEHAKELLELARGMRVNVNLIRYNEVPGLPFARPKSEDVLRFQAILRQGGLNAHVRKSRGRDIDAACGQLRRRELVQISQPHSSAGGFATR